MNKLELILEEKKWCLPGFKEYLLENDRSNRTIGTYLHNVILFAEYVLESENEEFDPKKVDSFLTKEYRSYLKNTKKQQVSSVNLSLASLKAYFEYLKQAEIVSNNPMVGVKKIKDSRPFEARSFSKKEYSRLKRTIYTDCHTLHIIIFELLSIGARVNEVVNLRVSDINMNTEENVDNRVGSITITGKGSKVRVIPLSKSARRALLDYLKIRNKIKTNSPFLLLSERKSNFSNSGIHKIIKKYFLRAGIGDAYTLHSFRHYTARRLIEEGVDLVTIAQVLGHSSPTLLMRYGAASLSALEKAIEKMEDE